MLIVVRRSKARSVCSLEFKPILSKRADCRSPADGGIHPGGGVAVMDEGGALNQPASPRLLVRRRISQLSSELDLALPVDETRNLRRDRPRASPPRGSSLLCQGWVAICGFLSVSPVGGEGYE